MFSMLGGTQARRLPGASQFPWKQLGLGLLAFALMAAVVIPSLNAATDLFSGKSAPAVQPEQQVSIAPAVSNPQVPQNVQENVVAAAPVVMDYQVTWTEVRGFNPFTVPVEEGLYNGEYSWSSAKSAYARTILPHLEGLPVAVAAARDEANKNIVLASLDADRYGPYLLLSVDGKKSSWCRLNLLPITWKGQATNGVTPEQTRVVARGEEIHLYGRYALSAGPEHLYWWRVVVNKSELPCS